MDSGASPFGAYIAGTLCDITPSALFSSLLPHVMPARLCDEIPDLQERVAEDPANAKLIKIKFCEQHNIGYQQLHDAQQNYKKRQKKRESSARHPAEKRPRVFETPQPYFTEIPQSPPFFPTDVMYIPHILP